MLNDLMEYSIIWFMCGIVLIGVCGILSVLQGKEIGTLSWKQALVIVILTGPWSCLLAGALATLSFLIQFFLWLGGSKDA